MAIKRKEAVAVFLAGLLLMIVPMGAAECVAALPTREECIDPAELTFSSMEVERVLITLRTPTHMYHPGRLFRFDGNPCARFLWEEYGFVYATFTPIESTAEIYPSRIRGLVVIYYRDKNGDEIATDHPYEGDANRLPVKTYSPENPLRLRWMIRGKYDLVTGLEKRGDSEGQICIRYVYGNTPEESRTDPIWRPNFDLCNPIKVVPGPLD